jgi:hypothetical protein
MVSGMSREPPCCRRAAAIAEVYNTAWRPAYRHLQSESPQYTS